jgi:DNA-directed RNA polymerase subunit beta
LAARTTADTSSTTPHRISFAKISEPLEVPKLLSLQTDSFNWLIGNEAWQDQLTVREAAGEDVSHKS